MKVWVILKEVFLYDGIDREVHCVVNSEEKAIQFINYNTPRLTGLEDVSYDYVEMEVK